MIKNGTNGDICITDVSINLLTRLFTHAGLTMPCGTGLYIKGPEELQTNTVNAGTDVYQFAGLVYEVTPNISTFPSKLTLDSRHLLAGGLLIGYLPCAQ